MDKSVLEGNFTQGIWCYPVVKSDFKVSHVWRFRSDGSFSINEGLTAVHNLNAKSSDGNLIVQNVHEVIKNKF